MYLKMYFPWIFRKLILLPFGLGLSLSLISCGLVKDVQENNSPETALQLATEELDCPSEDVQVQLLPLRPAFCAWHGNEIYEATGCGRTARYRCHGSKNFREYCLAFSSEEPTVKDGEPCQSQL